MTQLAPSPSPLAFFPDFIAQQEETVVLKGRQFGATYDVMTIDGRSLLVVEPGTASLKRRKRIIDAKGREVFKIRRKSWHFGGSCYFIQPGSRSDDTKVTLDFKVFVTGTEFTASFINAVSQQQEQLCFQRGYFSARGKIINVANGHVVATPERQISLLKKEYRVTVAQGVDMALVAAMLMCLDDKEKSHGNAPGLGGGRI